tara:strand:+ start:1511 stop:2026 length:516 start_codon:yes stop_codon:yes gene_type:complete
MSELRTNRIIPRDGLVSGASGGIIQVKQTFLDTAVSTSTSGSFVDIAGMSVSITPTRSDSKIFVMITLGSVSSEAGVSVGFRLLRGSTLIGNSSSTDLQSGFTNIYAGENSQDKSLMSVAFNFLDSPATTSATTYKLQWRNSSSNSYINRYTGSSTNYNGSSTITVMEISG